MTVDRWRLVEKLGEGYFGQTFRAEDSEGVIAEPIAMKLIPLAGVRGLHEDSLLKEIGQLYALTHTNLVAVRAEPRRIEYNGAPHLAIGLELCETTLADELHQSDDRDQLMRLVVADVLQGLAYMHEMGTVHRDLHAGNILRRGGTWKIGDFGQARFVNPDGVVRGGPAGAPEFVAPEVARGEAASVAVDVYALGVLAHYSITRQFLIHPPADRQAIARGNSRIHDSLPRGWRPFVRAATQELADRPTVNELRSLVPSYTVDRAGREPRTKTAHRLGQRQDFRPSGKSDVACSSMVAGHFEVFVLDADGELWHSWWWHDPGWSPWERMEASPLSAIAAGSHDHRHQEIFAITTDRRVLNRWNWLQRPENDQPDSSVPSDWVTKWDWLRDLR